MVKKLLGNWKSGLAFDVHTTSSAYLGIDETGHDRWDNTRSEMGGLVYQLKYKQDKSVAPKIIKLLETIGGLDRFELMIPIPATNKNRPFQPVELITSLLGQSRGVECRTDILTNDGDAELKGITDPVARNEMLRKAIRLKDASATEEKKILLVDDLYRSGSTLMAATEILYETGKAKQVSVLTMTYTRSNR